MSLQSFQSESESDDDDELCDVKVGSWVEPRFNDDAALPIETEDEFDNLCCEKCGSGDNDVRVAWFALNFHSGRVCWIFISFFVLMRL